MQDVARVEGAPLSHFAKETEGELSLYNSLVESHADDVAQTILLTPFFGPDKIDGLLAIGSEWESDLKSQLQLIQAALKIALWQWGPYSPFSKKMQNEAGTVMQLKRAVTKRPYEQLIPFKTVKAVLWKMSSRDIVKTGERLRGLFDKTVKVRRLAYDSLSQLQFNCNGMVELHGQISFNHDVFKVVNKKVLRWAKENRGNHGSPFFEADKKKYDRVMLVIGKKLQNYRSKLVLVESVIASLQGLMVTQEYLNRNLNTMALKGPELLNASTAAMLKPEPSQREAFLSLCNELLQVVKDVNASQMLNNDELLRLRALLYSHHYDDI